MFHEPWWLDIVTQNSWQATEVVEDGRVIGRLPYHIVHRTRPVITMPPLTHFLGPAIDEGTGNGHTRWLKRLSVTRELISQLPTVISFWQKFHRGVSDVLPFQAEKFTAGVQFTFEVEPAPEQVLWAALRDKHRNIIRKALKLNSVEEITDSGEFTRFYVKNLEDRGLTQWVDAELMERLLAAATQRDAGTMFGLKDDGGALRAAIFCARDATSSYYTLSTRQVNSGNAAVPMLIWEAMRRAARDGLIFDFDGVANAQSIRLFAGFGGTTRPRYSVSRNITSGLIRFVRRHLGLRTSTFES